MNFQVIENEKTVDIVFIDIQLHVVKPRKPTPLSRAIQKSIRSGRLGRAFTKDFSIEQNGKFSVSFPTPPELERITDDAERRGKKVRYIFPNEGIPVFAGRDLIEKLNSKTERGCAGNNA
jgi:hypothetical protein